MPKSRHFCGFISLPLYLSCNGPRDSIEDHFPLTAQGWSSNWGGWSRLYRAKWGWESGPGLWRPFKAIPRPSSPSASIASISCQHKRLDNPLQALDPRLHEHLVLIAHLGHLVEHVTELCLAFGRSSIHGRDDQHDRCQHPEADDAVPNEQPIAVEALDETRLAVERGDLGWP